MKNAIILTAAALSLVLPLEASEAVPDEWLTVAEQRDFRSTSTLQETYSFLNRVMEAAPEIIRATSFGSSGRGFALPLVIVSGDGAFNPNEMYASGKPILLFQSCIHAGEVDGKVASLMILRDIALGKRQDLVDSAILVFAPIYNADGHEFVSPYNRSNQNGPVDGQGYRATANGINLNRDYLRIQSPEAQAMARLVSILNPHIHVDNHVTNGSDHAWVLTWLVAEAPQLDPALDNWLDENLPRVFERTADAGHPNGPYVSLVSGSDPSKGMVWDVAQPRYSSGYFPLRNQISILIEMHAHKPFRDRVLANKSFMEELILQAGESGDELVRAVSTAKAATVAKGEADAEASEIVLRWGVEEEGETLSWPAYRWTKEDSVVSGRQRIKYHQGEIQDVELEWRHLPVAELVLPRPRGYIVSAGWPQIEEVVRGHGLRAFPVVGEQKIEVETIRLSNPEFASSSYQGTVMVRNFEVTRQTEVRSVPAESLWIPANQPNFEIAVQLFEPEAPDSLLRWGAVSSVFERKIYAGWDVLDEQAEILLEDESIRGEWESALEDETFADNPRARYLWWYQRTPYWDETVGLLPIFRVMDPPTFEIDSGP